MSQLNRKSKSPHSRNIQNILFKTSINSITDRKIVQLCQIQLIQNKSWNGPKLTKQPLLGNETSHKAFQ
jgi:hypothetical protein